MSQRNMKNSFAKIKYQDNRMLIIICLIICLIMQFRLGRVVSRYERITEPDSIRYVGHSTYLVRQNHTNFNKNNS